MKMCVTMRLPGSPVGLALVLLATALVPLAAEEGGVPLRNPGFEEGAEGWSLPPNFRVVEGVARSGKRSLRVENTDPGRYEMASMRIALRPGRTYRFSAWIKTQGVQGEDSGATVCVEWNGAKGWLGGSYPAGKKGDQDWYRVEAATGVISKDATAVDLILYLRKGMTGVAWFDDVSVELGYPPALTTLLLQPNYRGCIPAGTPDSGVRVRGTLPEYLRGGISPEETTLTGALLRGEEVVAERRVDRPRAGANEITLPAASLPAGDYQVRVSLHLPAGDLLGEGRYDVRKLAPDAPRPAVSIDARGRTLVNGKPFFPLGW